MKYILKTKNQLNLMVYSLVAVGIYVIIDADPEKIFAFKDVLQGLSYIVVPLMAAIFGGKFMDRKKTTNEKYRQRDNAMMADSETPGPATRGRV